MADLLDVVAHYVPLTVSGSEFHGVCPFEEHAEPLAVINGKWRCYGCSAHDPRDDAIGFLMLAEKIDEPGAQNLLELTTFEPTITKPTPPPAKYGIQRALDHPDKTILITDSRKAAEVADRLLSAYVCCNWTDHGSRWDGLEPLRGRNLLLWPTQDVAALERLESVVCDPRGLACTGKILSAPINLTEWSGTGDELIAAARQGIRPLRIPQVADAAQPAVESAGKVASPVEVPPGATAQAPDDPPAEPIGNAPQSRQDDAGPPPVQDSDWPQGTQQRPPRKRRLRVAGGTDVDAPDPDEAPIPVEMGEDQLSLHFAAQHSADWRYVKKWDRWLRYDGDGWRIDETEEVDRLAVEFCRQAVNWPEGRAMPPASRQRIAQRRTAGQVRDMARTDRRIAATADQWDTDPLLLGCPGGAVDLRTGKLIEGARDSYITLRTAVAPAAGEPTLWLSHLDKALSGDQDTIGFLRRYLGYMLTGEVGEHCLVFFYGTGRNGKGTIVETVIQLMGDYGYAAPMNLLMEGKSERHPTELAALRARRGVSASEPPEGARWDDGRIRFLTGGDTITARGMRQDLFSFKPTHKLLLMGNNMPSLRSVDAAIEARFKMIEFAHFFAPEERDIHFTDKLRAEWPQILQWMIEGCMEWQDCGLGMPESMSKATSDYLQSEDTFLDWLGECTDHRPGERCKSSDAYSNYKRWMETQGNHVPSHKAFVKKLQKRGYKTVKVGIKLIEGLTLRAAF